MQVTQKNKQTTFCKNSITTNLGTYSFCKNLRRLNSPIIWMFNSHVTERSEKQAIDAITGQVFKHIKNTQWSKYIISFWKWLTYLCEIRVTFFSIDTIVAFYVLKSIVHQASMATVVSKWWWAVYKVLFTERNKFASLLEVLSFQRSSLKNMTHCLLS